MEQAIQTFFNWLVTIATGLFTQGEWRIIVINVAYAFATTYILNVVRKALASKRGNAWFDGNPYRMRLVALIAGWLAAYTNWPDNAISLHWYEAGVIIGPISILFHHLLYAIVTMKFINDRFPFLYALVVGQPQRRTGTRTGPQDRKTP